MKKILFVCLGNICRSPTAEAVFRNKVQAMGWQNRVQHASCGTAGYHIGEAPDARTVKAALARGIDMSDLRGQQIQPEDFEIYDVILAMDKANLNELKRQSDSAYHSKIRLFLQYGSSTVQEVPDPYYGGSAGFERVLDLVENACDGLIKKLKGGMA